MSTQANDAVEAFMSRKAEFDELLARLQEASDGHFDLDPAQVHWGHVTDLADHVALLRRISDKMFGEGEYAE
jgi:hypothetical protein